MRNFEYHKASSIENAVSLLAKYGKEGKVLAGGTDLIPLMRSRTLTPKYIIDINGIPEFDYLSYDKENGLRIGALATFRTVGLSKIVKKEFPLLYEAIHQLGTTEIRNMGTVVGNICRASPAADTVPPLLVLKAKVKIAGPTETKIVPLEEFFIGPGKTFLEYYEVVTEVQVLRLPPGVGTAFLRVSRVAEDLAQVNVASVLKLRNGVCEDARIALGGVASTPIRANKAEEVLRDKKIEDKIIEEAAQTAAEEIKPITDVRSTREYRREISKVLVRQAIKISNERAK
jgi:carbon-monoxide dehydrogenase medium subunit